MKRFLLVLLACLVLSSAAAQNFGYLGLRLAGGTALDAYADPLPFLGFHFGASFTPVEFRAAVDTVLLAGAAHADLLYTQWFSDDLRGYVGGGVDMYGVVIPDDSNFGVHATAGVEYRTGGVELFVEAQPIYAFSASDLRGRFALGVNFPF